MVFAVTSSLVQFPKSQLRILLAHNYYQNRGGEDTVFEAELQLLANAGHKVVTFIRNNREITGYSRWRRGFLGAKTVWAWDSVQTFRETLLRERPDVVHFHNVFPLLSPALYYVCRELRIPAVQTLHNYRLLCPSAVLFREGKICEECIGRLVPVPGIIHKCYRDNRWASVSVAAMLSIHNLARTWTNQVDCYIALSEFAKQKFLDHGIPEQKIVVKPNFLSINPRPLSAPGEYAVFVGRLSPEKGIQTLLHAWQQLKVPIPLKIVGDGSLRTVVQSACADMQHVTWMGEIEHSEVIETIRRARFLVLPSCSYETFALAFAEAFACGIPVISSSLGALQEYVCNGSTGLQFEAGNAAQLANAVEFAWSNPEKMLLMGKNARRDYELKYTAEEAYRQLISIYERVLAPAKPPSAQP